MAEVDIKMMRRHINYVICNIFEIIDKMSGPCLREPGTRCFEDAAEVCSAQLLFEPLYRAGERGLRHSAPHGRFGEVEGVS